MSFLKPQFFKSPRAAFNSGEPPLPWDLSSRLSALKTTVQEQWLQQVAIQIYVWGILDFKQSPV